MNNVTIDITNIILSLLEVVFGAICIILTYYIVPAIKNKVGEQKYESFLYFIERMVKSAEQQYGSESGTGEIKKDYVMDAVLKEMNDLGLDFDEDRVSDEIEYKVQQMRENLFYTQATEIKVTHNNNNSECECECECENECEWKDTCESECEDTCEAEVVGEGEFDEDK